MPEPSVDLSYQSMDQLHSEAQKIDSYLRKKNVHADLLLKSIESVCKEGESEEGKGKLEMAYLYFYRCVLVIQKLQELEEYKKEKFYYSSMVKEYANTSIKRLEYLNPILKIMYEQEQQKHIAPPTSDEKELKVCPGVVKPQDMSANGVKESSISEEREYITSVELNRIVNCRKAGTNTTLIIDVRSSDDFENSRMKVEEVINIPVEQLPDGLTPSSIMKHHLKAEFEPSFKKRKEFDYVILVDWFSSKENIRDTNSSVGKMMKTLMTWDVGERYKRKPVVLEGGFDDWLSRFPLMTTEPNVCSPRMRIDNSKPIINVEFPSTFDLDTAFIEGSTDSISKKPIFDRSTKPVLQESKKTEFVNNGVNSNGDLEKTSELTRLNNGNAFNQFNHERTHTTDADSDADDEQRGKEYLQRGRRSALANTSSQMIYQDRRISSDEDEAFGEDRGVSEVRRHDEDEDSESETEIARSEAIPESLSNMKRSSSTPNILKPSINEGARPLVDRSTKPFPHDDRINSFLMRDDYSSSDIGKGLTGLKNLGNTCYMNSIIQCLSNTEPLKQHLLSLDPRKINSRSKTRGHIAITLRAILSQLWSGESGAVSCRELKAIVGEHRDTFQGYEQQDSHEFLTILIDWLHEDLKQNPEPGKLDGADESSGEKAWGEFTNKNNSIIRTLFYGQLKSTVSCSICHKESITFEPFSNLSLPLPTEERCSLADCLKLYVSNESILGWQCPKCKTSRNATKKLDITKLPPLLVIHLKRFTSDGWCRKRLTNVEFPIQLDMSDFVTGKEHRFSRYRLYAVSNHYGTMESGHYTAYCLNAPSKRWYKFDDQEVTSIPEPKSTAAYIVFYQFVPN